MSKDRKYDELGRFDENMFAFGVDGFSRRRGKSKRAKNNL